MKDIIANVFIPCLKKDYPKLRMAFTPNFIEM